MQNRNNQNFNFTCVASLSMRTKSHMCRAFCMRKIYSMLNNRTERRMNYGSECPMHDSPSSLPHTVIFVIHKRTSTHTHILKQLILVSFNFMQHCTFYLFHRHRLWLAVLTKYMMRCARTDNIHEIWYALQTMRQPVCCAVQVRLCA